MILHRLITSRATTTPVKTLLKRALLCFCAPVRIHPNHQINEFTGEQINKSSYIHYIKPYITVPTTDDGSELNDNLLNNPDDIKFKVNGIEITGPKFTQDFAHNVVFNLKSNLPTNEETTTQNFKIFSYNNAELLNITSGEIKKRRKVPIDRENTSIISVIDTFTGLKRTKNDEIMPKKENNGKYTNSTKYFSYKMDAFKGVKNSVNHWIDSAPLNKYLKSPEIPYITIKIDDTLVIIKLIITITRKDGPFDNSKGNEAPFNLRFDFTSTDDRIGNKTIELKNQDLYGALPNVLVLINTICNSFRKKKSNINRLENMYTLLNELYNHPEDDTIDEKLASMKK